MPIVALVLVISLPLLSFLLLGLAGRRVLGTASGYVSTLLQFISMGAALYAAWFYFFKSSANNFWVSL